MHLLFIALAIFLGTVVALSCLMLLPVRLSYRLTLGGGLGACGSMVGCAVGLVAICSGSFAATSLALPMALPIGSGAVALDVASRIFLMPVFGLGFVCALSGALHLRRISNDTHTLLAHWAFFALLLIALTVVCIARDAILFLFAWEILSVAPFFLIEFYDNDVRVRDASWVYLVAAHIGGLFLLAFFTLLWQATGSTAFVDFTVHPASGLGTALFILGVLGFGIKAGLMPLHVWLPEAHPVAPSHISALLSGAVINAGMYGLWRMLDFFIPLTDAPAFWGWGFIAIGLCTGLIGIFKAMAQGNLKRLLAYSSVENMGIVTVGLGAGLVGLQTNNAWICLLGFGGALYHLCNHAVFKGLLFLCAGEVLYATQTVRLNQLGGLQKRLPFVGVAFVVGTAAIACLPPFNGFMGEFLLALALAGGLALKTTEGALGMFIALAALIAMSAFAAATFTKVYGTVFLGEPRSDAAHTLRPFNMLDKVAFLPLALLASLCLTLGLAGYWIFPVLAQALPAAALAQFATAPGLIGEAADLLWRTAAISAGIMALAGFIFGVRALLLRGDKKPDTAPTWGCGFQKATARIQYSPASFTEPTAYFLGAVMGLKVRRSMDNGYFPVKAKLEVSAPDRVRTGFFNPLFQMVRHVCDTLKVLQHGRVHVYVFHTLLTVIVLLIWALCAGNTS